MTTNLTTNRDLPSELEPFDRLVQFCESELPYWGDMAGQGERWEVYLGLLSDARHALSASEISHWIEHAKDAPTDHDCTEWGCGCMGCFDRADRCEVLTPSNR